MADSIIKEIFILTLTYEMSVNTDTGEVLETRLIDRSVNKSDLKPSKTSSKKLAEDDPDAKLFLEDNKFRLNSAAISLMGIEAGAKLDIKYEDDKGRSIPVLGTDEVFGTKGGNKLTKTGTVAFRGNRNEELSKYGKEFAIIAHSSKPGLFILSSGEPVQEIQVDENISLDVDDAEFQFDVDLSTIVDDKDANITEIDSNFFKI